MIILTIRTDKPEAEIGLYDNASQIAYKPWAAHRQLAESIHITIKHMLDAHKIGWTDIEGIIYFKGPGSFTGLRIGASMANALGVANEALIVGTNGTDWIETGIKALLDKRSSPLIIEYGAAPHVTFPKK